jgi:hypothetical protein
MFVVPWQVNASQMELDTVPCLAANDVIRVNKLG